MAFVLGVSACGAWAFDDEKTATAVAQFIASQSDSPPRPRLEVSTTSLPRYDNMDGSSRSSRLDMVLSPRTNSPLGFSLGVTSQDTPFAAPPRPGLAPTVDLGLRWRATPYGTNRVDVTAWRRMASQDTQGLVGTTREASYGARVEMQMGSAAKRGLVAERGFVGLQLEGGARVGLRRMGHAPMVYYRNNF